MTKKYNLLNKSDMRKFEKSLEKEIYSIAKDSISNNSFEVTCPHCEKTISVKAGSNTCIYCDNEVTVDLDFDF